MATEDPPKRATRSSSVKPVGEAKPVSKSAPAAKPPAKPRAKRAASTEKPAEPPAKRSRTAAKKADTEEDLKEDEPAPKPRSRAGSAKPRSRAGSVSRKPSATKLSKSKGSLEAVDEEGGVKEPPAPLPQLKPYFNPLVTPVQPPVRPAPLLFAWGAGNFGQFAMGPDVTAELSKPRKSKWIEDQMEEGAFGGEDAGIEAIAAGGLHTLFIDEKGTVWSCGVNDDAALGRITAGVPDPEKEGAFLDADELQMVPRPLQSLVDEKFRAVKVAAGDSICAAISETGELRVWGSFRANEGSLGFSSGHKHQFIPTTILDLLSKPGDHEKAVDVAAGNNHLVVLTTHGNLYTWGAGEQSQLGRKVMERRKIHGTVPEKIILGTRSRKAVVIGAGNYHSFAVDDAGDVWGWGLNSMGQTGTGFTRASDGDIQLPKRVVGLGKEDLGDDVTIVQIVGGDHHTLFLASDGRLFATGRSNAGQLGLADDDPAFEDRDDPDFLPEPAVVTFPDMKDPIVHVSAGAHNNCAVTAGGALYSWGQGTQGELGLGDEEEAKTPSVVVRKDGGAWAALQVACGGQHSLALLRKKT